MVRGFRALRRRDAAGADGLLQSDLHLWRRPLSRRCEIRRRRWPDHCRSAARGGYRTVSAGGCRPGSISSGWRRPTTDDRRLPAVLANTSGFVYYVSITGITGSASADSSVVAEAVGAHQAPYRSAGLCRLRHPHAAGGPGHRRACRWRRWSVPALVDALRSSLELPKAVQRPGTVGAVADLAAALARGVRGAKQAAECATIVMKTDH